MKLPFWLYPAHWGLRGRMLQHAKVDYQYDDEIEREIAHLKVDYDGEDLEKRILQVKLDRKVITQEQYDDACIELIIDPDEKAKATLDVLRERGDITENEYQKEVCSRQDTPWFVFDVNYTNGELFMNSDWNESFINMLREIGYQGSIDDEVVQHYIQDMGHMLSESDYDAEPIEVGYKFVKATILDDENRAYE